MGYNWSGIGASKSTVEADDLMEGVARSELFLNQGIGPVSFREADPVIDGDTKGRPNHTHEGYVEKRHIFKPDFYASPSPRMEAVSSQVHWRTTGHSHSDGVIFTPSNAGTGHITIPGTATRLKLRDHARVYFTSTFYSFELGGLAMPKGWGGDDDAGSDKNQEHTLGGEMRRAGTIGLAVHGKDGMKTDSLGSTHRYIYTSTLYPFASAFGGESRLCASGFCLLSMLGRHQHSIIYTVDLDPGVYDIGLVFSCRGASNTNAHSYVAINDYIDGGEIRKNKSVFFMARNMVCDVTYHKRAQADEQLAAWRTLNDKDPQSI